MNSVLNLNTTWTEANFLNYIEHSFSGTVSDWYDSLSEDVTPPTLRLGVLAFVFKSWDETDRVSSEN